MDDHSMPAVTMTGRFRLFPLAPVPPPTKKDYKLTPEPADTDFRIEFPSDPAIGNELDDAARVWKVYRREAETFDEALLQSWSNTLNSLPTFAGLFSTVATSFVIVSYQFLQLDNNAYTAAALYILVTSSNNSTGMTLPSPPDLTYRSPLSRWINGLWFTSIFLSLVVALVSILAQQWISEYRARNAASARSPRDWVLRREVYFKSLTNLPVAEAVALLPFLLHLSLYLFLAGVVAFLWTLDKAVAIWMLVLGGLLGVFYIVCMLIPLWAPESPTATPLSKAMRMWALTLALSALKVILAVPRFVERTKSSLMKYIGPLSSTRTSRLVRNSLADFHHTYISPLVNRLPVVTLRCRRRAHASNRAGSIFDSANVYRPSVRRRLEGTVQQLIAIRHDQSGIRQYLEQNRDMLEANALLWLIVEVSDSDAVAVGLQALGALRWNSPVAFLLRNRDQLIDVPDEMAFTRSSSSGRTSSEVLRVMRSALCMRQYGQSISIWRRVDALTQGNYADYPDLGLLCASPDLLVVKAAAWREASPSLTSTALHAIRGDASSFTLAYLLCCDLAQFSDDDWNLAINTAQADSNVDVYRIPSFAKPFCLAVAVGGSHSWSVGPTEHPWVDPLLRGILECARDSEQNADFPGSYNLLPTSTLNLLSSQIFLEAIPSRRIPTILGYFFHDLDRAMRDGTTESVDQFWAVFARVACRVKIPDYLEADDLAVLSMCATALRTRRGSDGIRTGLLNAILLPPRLDPSISQSIWERLRVTNEYEYFTRSSVLDLADALAAGLCISVRDSQNPIQTAGWIELFFTRLRYLMVPTVGSSSIRRTQRDRFVHLMQHCEELRPQWLDGLDMDFDDSRAVLLEMYEDAVLWGSCQACPEFLGYLPVYPRSVA